MIDSPTLAKLIESRISERVLTMTYRVHVSENGKPYWVEQRDGATVRHDTEPRTNLHLRAGIWLLSLLPIECCVIRAGAPVLPAIAKSATAARPK